MPLGLRRARAHRTTIDASAMADGADAPRVHTLVEGERRRRGRLTALGVD
jgi:hypothetical protein